MPGGVRPRPLREVEQVAEPVAGDSRRELADDHAALDDDGDRRQSQADGGDAARGVRVGLVPDQPVVRVGLVQVVQYRGPLQLAELFVRRHAVEVANRRRVGHRSVLSVNPAPRGTLVQSCSSGNQPNNGSRPTT